MIGLILYIPMPGKISHWHRDFCMMGWRPIIENILVKITGGKFMEKRIALIGIIVENTDSVEKLNSLLHEYGEHIIGRMGIPYREKDISIISVVLHAEQDIISTLAGKLGMLNGVSVKTVYSKK